MMECSLAGQADGSAYPRLSPPPWLQYFTSHPMVPKLRLLIPSDRHSVGPAELPRRGTTMLKLSRRTNMYVTWWTCAHLVEVTARQLIGFADAFTGAQPVETVGLRGQTKTFFALYSSSGMSLNERAACATSQELLRALRRAAYPRQTVAYLVRTASLPGSAIECTSLGFLLLVRWIAPSNRYPILL